MTAEVRHKDGHIVRFELEEFLAWVTDSYSEYGDDNWQGILNNELYTREEVIDKFFENK